MKNERKKTNNYKIIRCQVSSSDEQERNNFVCDLIGLVFILLLFVIVIIVVVIMFGFRLLHYIDVSSVFFSIGCSLRRCIILGL